MNAPKIIMLVFVLFNLLPFGCTRTGFVIQCTTHSDCANNTICRDSMCRLTCNYNRDCQRGEYCSEGACMPMTLNSDAGGELADANLADVNTVDTSIPDTNLPDTNMPDTNLPDTYMPDTYMPDTNLPDTNMPDTNMPDTNMPDTNMPDTNLPDTNIPDTNMPDTNMPDTSMPDNFSGPSPLQLAVFLTPDTYTGNLGGIDGADGICQRLIPAGLDLRDVHALLCAYDLDLVNMPGRHGYDSSFPISWIHPDDRIHPDATSLSVFANNWADMLDGTISTSMVTATGYSGEVWTGCATNGSGDNNSTACSYNPTACACGLATGNATKWTVGSNSGYASQGDVNATDNNWIHDPCPGWGMCSCDTLAHLMCIGVLWE